MRREALLLSSLFLACAPSGASREAVGEHVARTEQAFASSEATLVDFELDGRLLSDTSEPGRLPARIEAQLMYAVGQLNGERANGYFARLELTTIDVEGDAPPYRIHYHAKLPVAWGGPVIPSTYELRLPARVETEHQEAFAEKYGSSCADTASGGAHVEAFRLFLFYRPQNAGCQLAPEDVEVMTASVKPSTANSTGKYPEYDRVWEDGKLSVVTVWSRAESIEKTGDDDEGAHAYQEFVSRSRDLLDPLGTVTAAMASPLQTDLAVGLPDGRRVEVHARLVPADFWKSSQAAFDAWYDALTPEADLVLYSGHAGLGRNVRALMQKGVFLPGKYVVWTVNGCDTFAYLDDTLALRRAKQNPDDPAGTKYMDVVSNVMAGYFRTSASTSMALLDGFVRAERTYPEIFRDVDPEQIIVVP